MLLRIGQDYYQPLHRYANLFATVEDSTDIEFTLPVPPPVVVIKTCSINRRRSVPK
jgi:hypothetical protein